MLGVDRDQPRAGGLGQRGHELAADDERLLVGQRDVHALGERDDRRAEAGRADDRVEHEVGAGLGDEPRSSPSGPASTSPPVHASAARAAASASVSAIRGHAVLDRLLDQRHVLRAGGQPDDLERALGARDDVERLACRSSPLSPG